MTPTDRKSVGDYYLLPAELFLFVGETCGLPRANTVRPYRVLGKLPYENQLFRRGLPSRKFGGIFAYLLKFFSQIVIMNVGCRKGKKPFRG